jgi:F-type H+-transporting ATPase subunit gamma
MKMVAAARLRRAQSRITQARPFADTLARVLANLAARTEHSHQLMEQREGNRAWFVVVSSDKGLCGSFNANLLRRAENEIRSNRWDEVELVTMGRKASDYFKRRKWQVAHTERETMTHVSAEDGLRLAEMFIKAFTSGQVDSVWIIFNSFVNMIRYETTLTRLLPIEPPLADDHDSGNPKIDYLYEPDALSLIDKLLPQHVAVQVQRALYDSAAAEQAARMTSMEAATKNAGEMIDSLTLLYNRTRQAAITKELIEIVSGAKALED